MPEPVDFIFLDSLYQSSDSYLGMLPNEIFEMIIAEFANDSVSDADEMYDIYKFIKRTKQFCVFVNNVRFDFIDISVCSYSEQYMSYAESDERKITFQARNCDYFVKISKEKAYINPERYYIKICELKITGYNELVRKGDSFYLRKCYYNDLKMI